MKLDVSWKNKILFLAICIAVLGFLFFSLLVKQYFIEPKKVCFESNCFFVELAKTNTERETGLMNRKELANDSGMLFIFEKEEIYPFWMKNTLIPLDIIWIGSNNKIVFIKENAQPCGLDYCPLINPGISAKYVLEINAGLVQKFGFGEGNYVTIK